MSIGDTNKLEKLAEGQYANIISNTNPQHLLAMMFYRLYEGGATDRSGQSLSNCKTLFQKDKSLSGITNPPVVRFNGRNSPKEVETAFSHNPDSGLLKVWNTFNNAQLTYLSPYVNFFSRFKEVNGGIQYKSIPLQSLHPKISVTSKEEQMLGRSNAIFGFLGLKSVDIELAGKYEETKHSDVKVEVVFAGNTLHIMDSDDYLPLVMPHYKKNNMSGHQLMLEWGYNNISSNARKSLKFTSDQIKEIEGQKMRFVLYYYKHDFNIEQDGSFTLNVSYIARASDQLKSIDMGMPSGKDFEDLYGSDSFAGTSGKHQVDEDFDSQIYKYIEDVHPSANERQRAIIRGYFYNLRTVSNPSAFSTTKKDKAKFLFKTAKQTVAKNSFARLKEIPALLRRNKLEFIFAMPEWKRHAYFMKCAVISAHLELMAKSEPHPKESGFPNLYKAVTLMFGANVPRPRVIDKKAFLDFASVAAGDIQFTNELEGANIFSNISDSSITTDRGTEYKGALDVFGSNYFDHTLNVSQYSMANGEFPYHMVEAKLSQPNYFSGATFYRMGDLLQAFMALTGGAEAFAADNVSVFLGTCRVRNRFFTTKYGRYFSDRDKQERFFPLYDIPIELSEFTNMINEKFVNKSTSKISFMSFFEGLMSIVRKYYLVGDAVTQSKLNHPARGFTMDLVVTDISKGKRIAVDSSVSISDIRGTDFKRMAAKGLGQVPSSDSIYNLFVVNMGSTAPSPVKKGVNEQRYDSYYVGSEFSTVKRAKFNRVQTATQKARESDNVAAATEDENGGLIPHLYNVDLDIVGNVRFTPGYYFNLKPFAPIIKNKSNSSYASGGILKRLGLDNLNVTITVNHKIDQRGFNTSLRSMAVVKNK